MKREVRAALLVWLILFVPPVLLVGKALPLTGAALWPVATRALGLSAMSALALSVILGIRSTWLDRFFGSLSFSFRVHHQVSLAILILAVLHLLSAAAPLASMDRSLALEFLVDWRDPMILSGWLALIVLAIVAIGAFIRSLTRRTWRSIHRWVIAGFVIAVGHFAASVPTQAWSWAHAPTAGLLLLAMAHLVLHAFYPRLLKTREPYEVISVHHLGPSVVEITLKPLGRGIYFEAGQFAYLSIRCEKGCGVSHDFHPSTMDSEPADGSLRFAIKALGEDSRKLLHLQPGNRATVEGPYGNLSSSLSLPRPQFWIAGGIGITPFLSYLRSLRPTNTEADIFLLALIGHGEDNVFKAELEELRGQVKGFDFRIHVDECQGKPHLTEMLPSDWREREIAISGPAAMARRFQKDLKSMGVRQNKIHTEAFDF